MFTPALLNFIRLQRKAGISEDDLRQQLVMVGWQPATIDDAMKGVGESTQFVRGVAPQINSPAAGQSVTSGSVNPTSTEPTYESTGVFQGTAQPNIDPKSILIGQTTDALTADAGTGSLTAAGLPPETIELSPPPSDIVEQPKADETDTTLPSVFSTQPAKKNFSALKFFLIAIFVLILVLGGVGLAAATGYLPMQWALGPALTKTMLMERGQTELDFRLVESSGAYNGIEFNATMSHDVSSPDVPLIEAALRFSGPLALSDVTTKVRVIGDAAYVLYQNPGHSAESSDNQWLELQPNELTLYEEAYLGGSSDTILSPTQMQQTWKDHPFLIIDRWLGPDGSYGLLVQRFSYRLDTAQFKNYILAASEQTGSRTDQERRMMEYLLEKELVALENTGGEVWVDVGTGLVKKLTFSANLVSPSPYYTYEGVRQVIPLHLQIAIEPTSEPLQLTPPPNAVPLTELLFQQREAIKFESEQFKNESSEE